MNGNPPMACHRDNEGFAQTTLQHVGTPVWAYFRQLSMKELYSVTTQLDEEVLFQISYRAGLTTSHMIQFRGVQYDIVRIDTFEGYKANLKLYCKRKK